MSRKEQIKHYENCLAYWAKEHNKEKDKNKSGYIRYNIIVFQELLIKLLKKENFVLRHDNYILTGECKFLEKELSV